MGHQNLQLPLTGMHRVFCLDKGLVSVFVKYIT